MSKINKINLNGIDYDIEETNRVTIEVDTEVKSESSNPVSSDAVYNYVDNYNITSKRITAMTTWGKREDLEQNDMLSVLFSKIKKWFADLKTVAFSGSYTDLTDTPSSATLSLYLNGNKVLVHGQYNPIWGVDQGWDITTTTAIFMNSIPRLPNQDGHIDLGTIPVTHYQEGSITVSTDDAPPKSDRLGGTTVAESQANANTPTIVIDLGISTSDCSHRPAVSWETVYLSTPGGDDESGYVMPNILVNLLKVYSNEDRWYAGFDIHQFGGYAYTVQINWTARYEKLV